MIPFLLQDFLVMEFKNLFKDYKLKDVNDNNVNLNIYPQFLPARKGHKDTEHYPYIIVRLAEGEDPDESSANICKLMIYTGVYDRNDNYQGYKDCMNIIQKIYVHLMSNRIFDSKYEILYPIKWRFTEEDYYPFFYAGMETNWQVMKVTMNDLELI